MKLDLSEFEKINGIKSINGVELDKEKTYLIMVNTVGMNYTDSLLASLKEISDAFQAAGIKSIVLLNPYNGGRPEFVIGEKKVIGN